MTSTIDLHSHSHYSDGALSPAELVTFAHSVGVECLALTDHDTVLGIDEASSAASTVGVELIAGVELSTRWQERDIHIVALDIDHQNVQLCQRLSAVHQQRDKRAREISDKLAMLGFSNAYLGAKRYAKQDGVIARPHFAQYLVEIGAVKDISQAFKRYLAAGKPAYAAITCMSISEAIHLTHQAGGVAVLAHPARYKLSRGQFKKLVSEFKTAGGDGLEVVTAVHSNDEVGLMARYCQQYDLAASVGSDFHSHEQPWAKLGQIGVLPEGCQPIWQHWRSRKNGLV